MISRTALKIKPTKEPALLTERAKIAEYERHLARFATNKSHTRISFFQIQCVRVAVKLMPRIICIDKSFVSKSRFRVSVVLAIAFMECIEIHRYTK